MFSTSRALTALRTKIARECATSAQLRQIIAAEIEALILGEARIFFRLTGLDVFFGT